MSSRQDRATKLLTYLAEVIVNGHPEIVGKRRPSGASAVVSVSASEVSPSEGSWLAASSIPVPRGTRNIFQELGPERFAKCVTEQKRVLITDTTFRDAHQSLLATRMRTYDMLRIAPEYATRHANLFSLEMWGGATFDTSMRFLKESPWD